MWMPREPDVFGKPVSPCSARTSRAQAATARTSSKATPGCGSRSTRSSSGWSRSLRADRPGIPVDHAEVDTPHEVCGVVGDRARARSGRSGKCTVVVCEPVGAVSGTRFWKKNSPATPSTQRLSVVGRSRRCAHDRLVTVQVVVHQVELGEAGLGKEQLARVGDAQLATRGLDDDRVVLGDSSPAPHVWL